MTGVDTLLRGAPVYTLDPAQPWAEAVAIDRGLIAAVGRNDELSALIGRSTRIVDLPPDALVLPGFIDGHSHYIDGPLEVAGVVLSECDTFDQVVSILREYRPEGGVVRGGGWRSHIFPDGPDRRVLDEIYGDVPAVLREINSHSLWVNSAALAQAGVDRNTVDPEPGYSMFVRDESGEPTGWVLEADAMEMIRSAVVPTTPEDLRRELVAAQPGYAAAGLTSVFDAGNFIVDEWTAWEIVADLAAEGSLGQRVVAAKASLYGDDPVADLIEANRVFRSAKFTVDTLKVFVDGVPEAHTAAYLEPYDDRPDTSGPLAAPEEDIRRWARAADAAGFAVHFHAIGDRAVRVALDAVEELRRKHKSGIDHVICHGDLIDPADLSRFAKLGVIWTTSGQWVASSPVDAVMHRRLGARAQRHYSTRSALEAGTTFTMGADYAASSYVSTYRPLMQIESVVTRRLAGVTGGDPLPPAAESLTVEQAVQAMTVNAARQLRIDGFTGSLRAGRDADLVVLERNLFEIPASEIAATPVLMTMRTGLATHDTLA